MYSYSLDFFCLDPMGSTNYGKLTNVSIVPQASQSAVTAANGSGVLTDGCGAPQKFDFITTAVNYNIIRISGGALGLKFRETKTGRCHVRCGNTYMGKHCNFHLAVC